MYINTINLFNISRNISESFYSYERIMSGKNDNSNTQLHELQSLKELVDKLISCEIEISDLDGFNWSFTIPQIGKEFDLIKVTEAYCLNIEIKSKYVAKEKIQKQLKQNKHYLENLGKEYYSYCVITDLFKCYKINNDEEIEECEIESLVDTIKKISKDKTIEDIEPLFNPSDYLISPLNSPEKFISNAYYLTDQQERIKEKVIYSINESVSSFYRIKGKAGTGKTLLLYDIGKHLSKNHKVLVIHCAILAKGQLLLNNSLSSFDIVGIKEYSSSILKNYDYILVDESQRIHKDQFIEIVSEVTKNRLKCIFSIDSNQILSIKEQKSDVLGMLDSYIVKSNDFELSIKIRTNKNLANIIPAIFNLNKIIDASTKLKCLSIVYSANFDEALLLINYYKQKGYTFINFTKSNYCYSSYEKYKSFETFDSHHIIGQEFDNVLVVLDDSFSYDKNNMLISKTHPNPDYIYIQLLFQAFTRARKNIAIIVDRNADLYDKMMTIYK